jgi:poly(3-hydroxybutyrate) depolymerase
MPSPGCSGGNPDAAVGSAAVEKPNGYDGSSPVPVLFAFHGAGGNTGSLQGPFASDAKARGYLGVYLKSSGSAWEIRSDTAVFDAAYQAVADNYCVDLSRVFAVGHSSGAQMITQLLCAGEDRFRAVAPVASSKYCNGWDATAAIVIHGVDDIERGGQGEMRYGLNDGDGRIDFGVYHDSNQCTDAATPFEPGGTCAANIDPGCVEYDDCAARTVFCNHNDPQYGTSNHGVPCFASPVMFDFFDEFQ